MPAAACQARSLSETPLLSAMAVRYEQAFAAGKQRPARSEGFTWQALIGRVHGAKAPPNC
ncbi:hypothetical protein DF3PB_6060003 [uncultured Defluviicoccus sp.]|uniref:Uncharacterized protein n=1 Tax=metagenome TaxID=256318 RepID=A0A380TIG1_9ZZZZ|nr:hypothetical protein DF3PB_6060003 [uncultured Defluviicoccus sp.]